MAQIKRPSCTGTCHQTQSVTVIAARTRRSPVLSSVFKEPSCARAYATGTGGYAAKARGTITAAGRHTSDYDPFGTSAAVQQVGTATHTHATAVLGVHPHTR